MKGEGVASDTQKEVEARESHGRGLRGGEEDCVQVSGLLHTCIDISSGLVLGPRHASSESTELDMEDREHRRGRVWHSSKA